MATAIPMIPPRIPQSATTGSTAKPTRIFTGSPVLTMSERFQRLNWPSRSISRSCHRDFSRLAFSWSLVTMTWDKGGPPCCRDKDEYRQGLRFFQPAAARGAQADGVSADPSASEIRFEDRRSYAFRVQG